MSLKLFGRELFGHKKGSIIISNARNEIKKSNFLPDFYLKNQFDDLLDLGTTTFYTGGQVGTTISNSKPVEIKKVAKKRKEYTPKAIFKLNLLNEKNFKINTDPDYVDGQIKILEDKLSLIQSSNYDMGNGVREIASMLIRMENRKKYPKFERFYSEYAYTTTKKISDLIKKHSYLKIDKVEQFLADMPEEAVKTMTEYKIKTQSLCGKLPIFYIIANQKDFKKTESRKDPILLAQSPFGHFWSILGAWDEEMIILDEL